MEEEYEDVRISGPGPGPGPGLYSGGGPRDLGDDDEVVDIFQAIKDGDIESIQIAIDRGADLDQTSAGGVTPLILSVQLGAVQITEMLIQVRGGGGVLQLGCREERGPGRWCLGAQRQARRVAGRAQRRTRTAPSTVRWGKSATRA
ncbi:hypothetical protein TSOC_014859 [Tetrabaena socialis]|uniref:Uncharacterized protein n=1 Tax=Tetrabaena socialis TaxID=47790 RepID=A0A2J7ZGG3_9CHLO|nr:hypothetical protein TSOC_014859 [Tetrabaena socialis]|eukprot:PNG99365.1 hypothetical protein TSOC_014859 [Tetrabaena socialis]